MLACADHDSRAHLVRQSVKLPIERTLDTYPIMIRIRRELSDDWDSSIFITYVKKMVLRWDRVDIEHLTLLNLSASVWA
jgi:hypothetical protein